MDKIKKVFSPGSSKDDELMYGDAEARRASATATGSQQEPEQLHAVPGSEQKEHSILRQIVNPGGEKYDDQRYGTTATTQEPVPEPGKLQTDPEAAKSDHTVMRQILNPNSAKYDESMFQETAATSGDRKNSIPVSSIPPTVSDDAQLQTDPGKKDHSILRQILNPHGDKYDEQGFGNTAHVVGDTDAQAVRADPVSNPDSSITRQILNPGQDKYDPVVHGTAGAAATSTTMPSQGTPAPQPQAQAQAQGYTTPGSCLSVKSGVEGPFARQADSAIAGAGSTTQTLPENTATTGESSTLGRDATIAGAGAAAAGGAGYYAATRENPDEKITDRPHPLSDRSGDTHINPITAPSETTATVGSTGVDSGSTSAGGAHINPIGAPEESLTSGGSNLERNVAIGAGAGGITGTAASTQLNSAPSDVEQATYTDRAYPVGGGYQHTTGPHQTDIANVLDPHVPGEFPAEDGTDKHDVNNPPLGPAVATDEAVDSTATGEKSTIGAAAGAAGVGGLVGAGAVASQSHSAAPSAPEESTSATSHPGGASYPIQTTTNTLPSAHTGVQGPSETATAETTEKSSEHNYSRDAAVAAGAVGAGATGYGVHEATKDREDTGPASKTIGPHESNIANVIDPRVQPEPEKMKESKTVGPHSSDLANKVDPRVESDPAKAEEKESTATRDAALVGGTAAVAGAGTYAATQHDDSNTAQPSTSTTAATSQETAQRAAAAQAPQPGYDQSGTAKTTESEKSSEKGEKKHGLLHKILHPGKSKEEKEEEKQRQSIEQSSSGNLNHPLVSAADVKDGRISTDEQPKAASSLPPPSNSKLNHPLVTADDIADNRISTDDKGHNKLHKKSVEQTAATTTIGDSTSSAAPRHMGTDGPIGRDNEVSGTIDPTYGQPGETVIEPHTGLPMNVGKYGVGSGGTDGAQQISGYHETDPAIRGASVGTAEGAGVKGAVTHAPGEEGVAGPDWEAIKKANTPY